MGFWILPEYIQTNTLLPYLERKLLIEVNLDKETSNNFVSFINYISLRREKLHPVQIIIYSWIYKKQVKIPILDILSIRVYYLTELLTESGVNHESIIN